MADVLGTTDVHGHLLLYQNQGIQRLHGPDSTGSWFLYKDIMLSDRSSLTENTCSIHIFGHGAIYDVDDHKTNSALGKNCLQRNGVIHENNSHKLECFCPVNNCHKRRQKTLPTSSFAVCDWAILVIEEGRIQLEQVILSFHGQRSLLHERAALGLVIFVCPVHHKWSGSDNQTLSYVCYNGNIEFLRVLMR